MINPAHAYQSPLLSGALRATPEDFLVEEVLGFSPSGEGEHLFLLIEKRGANTHYVAEQLARRAAMPLRQISYSGLKDRNALCRQWFSVHCPGKDIVNPLDWQGDGWRVTAAHRHSRKLRRGVHRGNRFVICVRNITGDDPDWNSRLTALATTGVPNYFGEQRFGRSGDNVAQARQWLSSGRKVSRHQRSIYLSSMRAFLFNQLLEQRVKDGSWCQILPGEILMLAGSSSVFLADHSEGLRERLLSGDVHTSGPLFGRSGKLQTDAMVAELEQTVFAAQQDLCDALLREGLQAERRALRVVPQQFSCLRDADDTLQCSFELPRGSYATAVLREICLYTLASENPVK